MFSKTSTRAFVISSYNRDEADKRIRLLTERFGLVHGLTKSVRKEKSKLRYALGQYNLVEVELVNSKSGWRTTGASLIDNYFAGLSKDQQLIIAKAFSLIERLVLGEDGDPELFLIVKNYVDFLGENQQVINGELLKSFELHFISSLMRSLGYLNLDQLDIALGIPLAELSIHNLENLVGEEAALARAINQSLEQTQI